MDYLCYKIENQLPYVDDLEVKDLMTDLAELMHDLEWWQSGDYGRDTYEKTLSKFKTKWFGDNRNERLKEYINKSLDGIKAEIDNLI